MEYLQTTGDINMRTPSNYGEHQQYLVHATLYPTKPFLEKRRVTSQKFLCVILCDWLAERILAYYYQSVITNC